MIYEKWSDAVTGAGSDVNCKIQRIDSIIDALLIQMAVVAGNADLKEYQLDDGQTKIRCVYSSVSDVQRDINALERLKQSFINRSVGRVVRLRDARNF